MLLRFLLGLWLLVGCHDPNGEYAHGSAHGPLFRNLAYVECDLADSASLGFLNGYRFTAWTDAGGIGEDIAWTLLVDSMRFPDGFAYVRRGPSQLFSADDVDVCTLEVIAAETTPVQVRPESRSSIPAVGLHIERLRLTCGGEVSELVDYRGWCDDLRALGDGT